MKFDTQPADFRIVTVLPVKALCAAKSRLQPLLTAQMRYRLALQLFLHTIQVLKESHLQTVVISTDPSVLAEAFASEVGILDETGLPLKLSAENSEHLNRLLPVSIAHLLSCNDYDWLLILPSDLPLLTSADVQLVRDNLTDISALIVPDRNRRGTNLLALRVEVAQTFEFQFGLDSFNKHCRTFEEMHLTYKILEPAGITFDLDTTADWEQLTVLNPNFSLKTPGYAQSYPHSESKCG